MGICGPPPKTKKSISYRKPGKTLNANRRNKLVNMLKSERNKKRAVGKKHIKLNLILLNTI